MKTFIKYENLHKQKITDNNFEKMDALRDLFDERIIEIMTLFMENPGKKFFLSDVANKSKVNITTTFRILNRLVKKGFIKSSIIGKTRAYELEQNQKTMQLLKLLKKEDDPLQTFIEFMSNFPRLKKIILESREKRGAKVVLVGNFLSKEKIEKKVNDIRDKYNFYIKFAEISKDQYTKLKGFKSYGLDEKTIWTKENSD